LKILFILPEYYPHSGGGISTYYLHYIKAIQPFCTKIKVIVGSGFMQSADVFNHSGVEIEYLKPAIHQNFLSQFTRYDIFPDFRNNIAAAWGMWQQAQSDPDFDIIECTDFGLGFIPWLLEHTRPVVMRLHGSSGQIALHEDAGEHPLSAQLYQSAESALLPLSDALISHSHNNAQFWNNLLQSDRVKTIYPIYINNDKPLPLADRENFGLITARVQKWKGPVELCKAMALTTKLCNIKWYGRDMPFEGNPSTTQYIARHFPAVYNKTVHFKPPVNNNAIHLLQHKAKFGIVPSTWDMFNFTTLEFMCAGTPVICSDGAGASSLIEHGKNGFKYPANDISALARCIDAVNGLDEIAYKQIADAAIDTIKLKLGAEGLTKANLEAYQSVMSNFKPAAESAFFNKAYRPCAEQHKIDAVLDRQPLSLLKDYFLRRVKSKILSIWKP